LLTGDERRSIPSTSSGKGVNKNSSEVNSGRLAKYLFQSIGVIFCFNVNLVIGVLMANRSNRKRRYSSLHSNDGLEPVTEDNGCHHPDPNFNVSRLSGIGPTLEQGKIYISLPVAAAL
jgi:hypothetical protein